MNKQNLFDTVVDLLGRVEKLEATKALIVGAFAGANNKNSEDAHELHKEKAAAARLQLKSAKLESTRLKLETQKLRLQKLQRKNAEVEPTVVELFHDITIKVGQKEIQDFLEVYRRDTEESVKQVVQALSPTKH